MPFAPEYVTYVLNENFEDAKALFLAPLMAIHYAHLVMLARAGHRLARPTRAHCARRSTRISSADVRQRRLRRHLRGPLLLHRAARSSQRCGEDVAGRLHTARSRNDIDMTMYRMRQREFVLGAARGHARPARARCSTWPTGIARRCSPCTRTRSARSRPPSRTTCSRSIEQLERDAPRLRARVRAHQPQPARRLRDHRHRASRSIASLTASLLGFSAPTGNTYGSIATVDYLLESTSASAVLLVGLGRFVQDLLLWCTAEFGYLRFGDGFVQGSSIMPQKRNPVAIEHARAIGSKALGAGAGDRHRASTTRRSATSSTPRTTCSRSSSRCSATPRAR